MLSKVLDHKNVAIANGPVLIGVGGPARGLYRLVGIQLSILESSKLKRNKV